MARIVLTGYSGLLGKALLEPLAAGGNDIICLGRTPPREDSGVRYVHADLASDDFTHALPRCADAVIHLAQGERYNQFPDHADSVFRVNVAAVSQLLAWGHDAGIRHFIHASTGGMYARRNSLLHEADSLELNGPLAHYLSTKRSAEILAAAYEGRFVVAALRYFFIYGAGQKQTMLIPRLIASVRDGRPLRLAGRDGIRINPIHVSDAAAATVAALRLVRGDSFNIAGPDVLSLREVGNIIGKAVGCVPRFDERADEEEGHLMADISKMRSSLAMPLVKLAEGIVELCGAERTSAQ